MERILMVWAGVILILSGASGQMLDETCLVAEQPAATLLFPYFEVLTDEPEGPTTLVAVVNAATEEPTLAHAVLWTDWGVPAAGFDLFLMPGDVVTINLRDVFASGRGPTTGPGAFVFDGCTDTISDFMLSPELMRALFSGRPVQGGCFGSPQDDPDRVVGFLTVDTARRCSAAIDLPADTGYFGQTGVVSTENRLWGDFFFIDSGEDFAQGQAAVSLVADPQRFGSGDRTFYGKFVGLSGQDARTPLSSEWRTRYLNGGAFDGGTRLLVWRDIPSTSILPVACGETPTWFPLDSQGAVAWNEEGAKVLLGGDPFPLATQQVDVASELDPPFSFGWLDLDLDRSDGSPRQAFVMSVMSALGRFSVGQAGTRTNDLCHR